MNWDGSASAAAAAAVALVGTLALRARRAAVQPPPPPAPVDPNAPTDAEGRVFHLRVLAADVAPRVLSVGDVGRAARIAAMFDDGGSKVVTSPRGFVTHTGSFRGVRVSIVATGMGLAMMDFVVREARAVVDGPMAIVRFGTCGGLRDVREGSVVVATGSVLVRREPDLVAERVRDAAGGGRGSGGAAPYSISAIAPADAGLTALFASRLRAHVDGAALEPAGAALEPAGAARAAVVAGVDASADGFYASQGREGRDFLDFNSGLLDELEARVPDVACMQMETFQLLDLARCSAPGRRVAAAAATIVMWNRRSGRSITSGQIEQLEALGGRAALEALTSFPLGA